MNRAVEGLSARSDKPTVPNVIMTKLFLHVKLEETPVWPLSYKREKIE